MSPNFDNMFIIPLFLLVDRLIPRKSLTLDILGVSGLRLLDRCNLLNFVKVIRNLPPFSNQPLPQSEQRPRRKSTRRRATLYPGTFNLTNKPLC
jgi:hypothetical protein